MCRGYIESPSRRKSLRKRKGVPCVDPRREVIPSVSSIFAFYRDSCRQIRVRSSLTKSGWRCLLSSACIDKYSRLILANSDSKEARPHYRIVHTIGVYDVKRCWFVYMWPCVSDTADTRRYQSEARVGRECRCVTSGR